MGKIVFRSVSRLVTVQDLGRFGGRRYGIPCAGVMDRLSMCNANRWAGNPDHVPVIEWALGKIIFEALEPTTIGLSGPGLDREGCWSLAVGEEMTVEPPRSGVYGYLAIAGHWTLDTYMDSYSTYLPAGLGGFKGRSLKVGDQLQTTEIAASVSKAPVPWVSNDIIRMVRGPEYSEMMNDFTSSSYTILSQSDRVGLRLSGPSIQMDTHEIRSAVTLPGMIQVPGNGQPIVLMKDCGTTGGYPRVATVLEEDLDLLSQRPPGSRVRFQWQL